MSRIIVPISYEQFIAALEFVKNSHLQLKEPIPEITSDNIPKIKTALSQPFQTFDSIELYKGFVCKAAMMFYMIIDNHVLTNGNKRMACFILAYFCFANHYDLNIPDKAFRKLAKEVANPHEHEAMIKKVQDTIRKHLKTYKKKGFR